MPADGFVARIEQKGGRPLRGGLGPVTLLRERQAEIVPGHPIGRVAGDGGAPALFRNRKVTRVIGVAWVGEAFRGLCGSRRFGLGPGPGLGPDADQAEQDDDGSEDLVVGALPNAVVVAAQPRPKVLRVKKG
jgi:hypothetical protein